MCTDQKHFWLGTYCCFVSENVYEFLRPHLGLKAIANDSEGMRRSDLKLAQVTISELPTTTTLEGMIVRFHLDSIEQTGGIDIDIPAMDLLETTLEVQQVSEGKTIRGSHIQVLTGLTYPPHAILGLVRVIPYHDIGSQYIVSRFYAD